ncbi:MAG: T9SS type A sorting domain-containing protein [Ignavibacteria bacterium]
MLKRLLLVGLIAIIGISTADAQFSKAEWKFLLTPHKMMYGENVSTTRVDGKPVFYGLPSLSDLISKFNKSRVDRSTQGITTEIVFTGRQTVLDYPSNSSPIQVWQDPLEPNNIHAVTMYNDGGLTGTRLTSYIFSSDRGATWTIICDVPSVRSGFSTIDGFSDGTALVTTHTADPEVATTYTRSMAYKDLAPGAGSFTRFTPPGLNLYIWGRIIPTKDLTQTNKFVLISSLNGSGDSAFMTRCTDVSSTPGTWTNWNYMPNTNNAEKHPMARGTDGRIGLAYMGVDTSANVWFMESTDNGATFSAPLMIYQWTPTWHVYDTDSIFADYGPWTSLDIAYKGNTPVVTFEGILQQTPGSANTGLESKIFFWSQATGVKVVADTNTVPFFPFVGLQYNDAFMSHPSIGTSADGNAIFISFMAASGDIDATDSTSFCDSYLYASNDGGMTWPIHGKLNPNTPRKDWRYPNLSNWNDNNGLTYYANMVATPGLVAGVFNGSAPASLEDFTFVRAAVTFTSINTVSTEMPEKFSLSQNYPNPFNPTTNIKFAVAKAGFVTLKVYDLSGKEISSLVKENLAAGTYNYAFDGAKLASGIYFYTLTANGFSETKKMMLIK